MQSTSKPEPAKSGLNADVIASAAVVGYLFSMFIFIGFMALLKLPLSLPGNPEYWAILLAVLTAGMYLIAIPLDGRNKIVWFRVLLIALCVSFIASLLVLFEIYLVAVALSAVLIIPAVLCSIMCVSYPGYYTETRIRGKVVSLTVFFVFAFVATAALASILLPELGLKAGYLVYGISALVLIPLAIRLIKSPAMQYIARPHKVSHKNNPNYLELKKYYAVLFMYKICLGMLLRVFLSIPDEKIALETSWAVVCSVAAIISPFLGKLTDKKGRKVMFNLACALLALLFGLFAFTGQGSFEQLDISVILIGGLLFGVSYPSMLVSEYLIFQELSDDNTRLHTFAWGMFVHVGGIALGLIISTAIQTPDISYYLLVTNLLTVGLFITTTAIEPLPNKEELAWQDALRHVYIYYTESGIGLYEYSFRPGESRADEALVTGGLKGITGLIAEMTKRDGNLTAIKQQNGDILFHTAKWVTVALLAEKDLKVLHAKAAVLAQEFEEFFAPYLEKFSGNVAVFAPAETLIRRTFKNQVLSQFSLR